MVKATKLFNTVNGILREENCIDCEILSDCVKDTIIIITETGVQYEFDKNMERLI